MQIILNGEKTVIAADTVAALAEALKLNPTQIAIERNREIVPKSAYGNTDLSEGDEVEIVAFIGGG